MLSRQHVILIASNEAETAILVSRPTLRPHREIFSSSKNMSSLSPSSQVLSKLLISIKSFSPVLALVWALLQRARSI